MPIYEGEPTKDGRKYYFKIYKKDGLGNNKQYESKKYATKKEASKAELEFLDAKFRPNHIKFGSMANLYFNDGMMNNRASTIQSYLYSYQKCIEPFFKDKYIEDINMKDMDEWARWLDTMNFKTNYKNKVLSILSILFTYGIKYHGLTNNYAKMYGRFKNVEENNKEKLRYITYEEWQQFISVVDDDKWNCFFTTLYFSGARKGEIQALQWKDINFGTNTLSITKTLSRSLKNAFTINPTKTGETRTIAMNKSMRESLYNYKLEQMKYMNYSDDWFVFGDDYPLPRTTIDRNKTMYFSKSGLNKEITIHEFRHSAVTLAVNLMLLEDKNMDVNKALIILSKRFGHTPEVMLRTYAHLWEDKLQEPIVNLLDKL